MRKYRQPIAILVCCIVLFALLFSVFFISTEVNHDCCGDECSVCLEMQFCAQLLKALTTALIITTTCAASYCLFSICSVKQNVCDISNTLVSLKVKLSY